MIYKKYERRNYMPVIARFFGITIKMYLRQKEHKTLHH